MTDENNNKEYKNYKSYKMNEIKLMIYNETGKNTEVIKLKYNDKKQPEHLVPAKLAKQSGKEIDV